MYVILACYDDDDDNDDDDNDDDDTFACYDDDDGAGTDEGGGEEEDLVDTEEVEDAVVQGAIKLHCLIREMLARVEAIQRQRCL